MTKYRIGNALPMGATLTGSKLSSSRLANGQEVQFVMKNTGRPGTGLVLYDRKSGDKTTIPFTKEHQIGNVYSLIVEGIRPDRYTYTFMEDGCEVMDPYAKVVVGNEVWGGKNVRLSAGIGLNPFSWEGDSPLYLPFEDSVFYQLHVRGFTRHSSSGVKKKGTFEGVVEKIPYLKELGITALELLPAYEFMEQERSEEHPLTMEYVKANYKAEPARLSDKERINYWGFKEAAYFAPKASYSASKHPDISFKNMVKELHKQGIEIIMQFYFLPAVNQVYLLEVLRFWVQEYHVDGFRLLGTGIPIEFLASDPILYNTKLLYENFDGQRFYEGEGEPVFRHLATCNDGAMFALRHFLKGDVGALGTAFEAMLYESRWAGNMVYMTNYNSFTLKDMVSYDRKHNEENGEEGRDGNNHNVSWNCGIEGPSKRKNILALRKKQMKNALVLLLFSKGTPVILAGDEFENSQNGNNNPYCQDNLISWLNWRDLAKNREQFQFTKELIGLRKEFTLLKIRAVEKNRRTRVEYPYLSYHGKDAWKLSWNESNEEAGGILFYSEQTYLYLCINMNWQEKTLALPNLPGKSRWELLLDTSDQEKRGLLADEKEIFMRPRSIKIITAKGSKSDFDESLSAF